MLRNDSYTPAANPLRLDSAPSYPHSPTLNGPMFPRTPQLSGSSHNDPYDRPPSYDGPVGTALTFEYTTTSKPFPSNHKIYGVQPEPSGVEKSTAQCEYDMLNTMMSSSSASEAPISAEDDARLKSYLYSHQQWTSMFGNGISPTAASTCTEADKHRFTELLHQKATEISRDPNDFHWSDHGGYKSRVAWLHHKAAAEWDHPDVWDLDPDCYKNRWHAQDLAAKANHELTATIRKAVSHASSLAKNYESAKSSLHELETEMQRSVDATSSPRRIAKNALLRRRNMQLQRASRIMSRHQENLGFLVRQHYKTQDLLREMNTRQSASGCSSEKRTKLPSTHASDRTAWSTPVHAPSPGHSYYGSSVPPSPPAYTLSNY